MSNKVKLAIISDDTYNTRYLFLEVDGRCADADLNGMILRTARKLPEQDGCERYHVNVAKTGIGFIPQSNVVTMEYGFSANFSSAAITICKEIVKNEMILRGQVVDTSQAALAMLEDKQWKDDQVIDLLSPTPFLTINPSE